VLQFSSAAVR